MRPLSGFAIPDNLHGHKRSSAFFVPAIQLRLRYGGWVGLPFGVGRCHVGRYCEPCPVASMISQFVEAV